MGHFSLRANNPLRNIRNENLPLPIELHKTVRYIYKGGVRKAFKTKRQVYLWGYNYTYPYLY